MRKVLSALCLLILASSVAVGQPKGSAKAAPSISGGASAGQEPSVLLRLWKSLNATIRTFDEPPPPPPPPERVNSPVPT